MTTVQIVNNPISSNTYIVYNNNSAIVIDPGSDDISELSAIIDSLKLKLEYIFLTHEHFDHILGCEKFRTKYQTKVVANEACNKLIQSSKGNLSLFFDQRGFECKPVDFVVNHNMDLRWSDEIITIIQTPGHTQGGICLLINNMLFTGDTFIPGHKTVTKLPNSDKEALKSSIKILNKLKFDTIYPGHGEIISQNKIGY